jgi:nicotinamide-nucleotide amidase
MLCPYVTICTWTLDVMKAEIISIGNEILRGEITDTNASYLAAQLPLLGIDLNWVTQVGDSQSRLVEVFHQAWGRSDLILATGGLGPTADDLTREALAEVFGEELRIDPSLEAGLRDIFSRWGRAMPSHNLKQAAIIPSAQSVPNHRGTAPGWWIERNGRIISAMPGPPNEMQSMWEDEIVPRLTKRHSGEVIVCRTLKTFGVTEAGVDEMVGPLTSYSPAEIGIYAKPDGIHLRLVAKGSERSEADESISQAEASLREIMGNHVWGVDDDTLVGVIGKLLRNQGQTLATMESRIGGTLAASFSDAPENRSYYKGGIVIGSEGVAAALNVEGYPAVLGDLAGEEAAWAMACAAREHFCADIGMGVCGPGSWQEERSTVSIAVGNEQRRRTRQSTWPPLRLDVNHWVTVGALFELRQLLLDAG